MKRLHAVWIIVLLAAGVCAFGLWSATQTTGSMTARIQQVAQEIKNGDIPNAYAHSRETAQQWEEYHQILCMFLSHKELETIGREFSKLPALLSEGEQAQATLQCVQLLSYMKQLHTSELPLIENIL